MIDQQTKKKNFRHGHRERVRARFSKTGLLNFEPYEVFELLLFYSVPRRDTKEMAHALEDSFSTVEAALCASEEEICCVEGIGARTAAYFHRLLPFLYFVAKEEKYPWQYEKSADLAAYLYRRFAHAAPETAVIVFFNHRREIIRALSLGATGYTSLANAKRLAAYACEMGAPEIALCLVKGDRIPFPNGLILDGFRTLVNDLSAVGVTLGDFIILGAEQYCSVLRYLRGTHLGCPTEEYFVDSHVSADESSFESEEALSSVFRYALPNDRAATAAHELISEYGSIGHLLSVPYETLAREKSEYVPALLFLQILRDLHSYVHLERARSEKQIYRTASSLGSLFCDILGIQREERVALALLDADDRLVDVWLSSAGSVNAASFVTRSLIEQAVRAGARSVAIAHNHPFGRVTPSTLDMTATQELSHAFRSIGIRFLEHFIVTEREYDVCARCELRAYVDVDDDFYLA